jgi:DNA adenine methylase
VKLHIERPLRAAIFFFIREYSYAAMFRYNSAGEFNVPYGGISYNRKFMTEKIGHFKSPAVGKKLNAARFEKMDFASFLAKFSPGSGDFVFADPPYDPDYSAYGRVFFGRDDQQRLADFLLTTPANWMLVIKSTDFIRSLYCDKGVTVREFDKKYVWTIKERNVRDVVHLMVSNY